MDSFKNWSQRISYNYCDHSHIRNDDVGAESLLPNRKTSALKWSALIFKEDTSVTSQLKIDIFSSRGQNWYSWALTLCYCIGSYVVVKWNPNEAPSSTLVSPAASWKPQFLSSAIYSLREVSFQDYNRVSFNVNTDNFFITELVYCLDVLNWCYSSPVFDEVWKMSWSYQFGVFSEILLEHS